MRILLSILLIISPILGHAQILTSDKVAAFNRTSGTYVYENYAANQNFDTNTVSATPSGTSTVAVTTSATAKLIGAGSLLWTSSVATETVTIRSKPVPLGLNGQNCQTKFTYALPYVSGVTSPTGRVTVVAKNSAGTSISAVTTLDSTFELASPSASKTVIVFYPCPYNSGTPANSYVDLVITNLLSQNTPFVLDEKFDTYAVDIGQGVPNNEYTAMVSATGVVTNEGGGDWINGNCVYASSVGTCTLSAGISPNAPMNCVATANTNNGIGVAIQTITTTTFTINPFTTSTGAVNAQPVFVKCAKAGSDFIQPTITPNNWNYDWMSFVPVWVGNTPTLNECQHKRNGADLLVRCKVTMNAGTATELRMPLPNGLLTAATDKIPSIQLVGDGGINGSTNQTKQLSVLAEPSVGYLTFSYYYDGSATSPLTKQNGNVSGIASQTVSFYARVPIAGWTENQNAPQLIGSVTSNYNGALRESFASTNGTCSAGTCALLTSSGDMTIAFNATGSYTATVTPAMSAEMNCVLASSQFSTTLGTVTSSTVGINTRVQAGSNANAAVTVRCIGPR